MCVCVCVCVCVCLVCACGSMGVCACWDVVLCVYVMEGLRALQVMEDEAHIATTAGSSKFLLDHSLSHHN